MNPLWSDILAQGRNIQHVLDHLYGAEQARLDAVVSFIQPQKPILLVGIASAAYLCHPFRKLLLRCWRLSPYRRWRTSSLK